MRAVMLVQCCGSTNNNVSIDYQTILFVVQIVLFVVQTVLFLVQIVLSIVQIVLFVVQTVLFVVQVVLLCSLDCNLNCAPKWDWIYCRILRNVFLTFDL